MDQHFAAPRESKFRPTEAEPVFMASGTTVPTSWTTVYTAPNRKQVEVTWCSFYATDTDATYVVKVRITTAAGVSAVVGQGKPSAAGYVYQLCSNTMSLTMSPGSTLDIIGSGAGTVSINYYISGIERGVPA